MINRSVLVLVFLGVAAGAGAVESVLVRVEDVSAGWPHPVAAEANERGIGIRGVTSIYWAEEGTLVYRVGPAIWNLRPGAEAFEPIMPPSEFDLSLPVSSATFGFNDFVVVDSGDVWKGITYAMLSQEHGFRMITPGTPLDRIGRRRPAEYERPFDDDATYWQKRLWGPYMIVRWPEVESLEEQAAFGFELFEISLRDLRTDSLTSVVPTLQAVKHRGSAAQVAVDFARFRVAVFAIAVNDPGSDFPRGVSSVYMMELRYDGSVSAGTTIYQEPREDSAVVDTVAADQPVQVATPEHYEVLPDGSEDFWYRVTYGETEGWVHGRDVVIEGTDWRDRLGERGSLVRWEDLGRFEQQLIAEESEENGRASEDHEEEAEPVGAMSGEADPPTNVAPVGNEGSEQRSDMRSTLILAVVGLLVVMSGVFAVMRARVGGQNSSER